ncbi:uncharacterized protein PODANS_5_490 [Podospora anserina S mat+]|uniref:Podospora anserina S mat+ genomic DNA chromosome 5, supercontig 1 n=1 Tax=Podospora anserina (strain S / ATCC MYA-4624 / DSM 980 / FGSC 10383) TaxID=515849 RepID=B2AF55_PODAN|nr:uncharacterized protein PODANS_5_490 [Podospora anserina S mat+]CAP62072.1 unnamed protein product [Podospora anserina S mat+]CDP29147.1 Putative protein of unknown function [Podospora anserina S mat+]
MGSTTIIRGFKLSVATLDAFLSANNVDETYGTPPFYEHHLEDKDPISKLLFSKISHFDPNADKNKFRVLIPSIEGIGRAKTAYVAYAWAAVRVHREVKMDEDLPEEIPKGFEELRQEILSYSGKGDVKEEDKVQEEGKIGIYLVVTYNIRGYYGKEFSSKEGL